MTDTQDRIARAENLETLSRIASDAEAMMDVEHRSQTERDELQDALRRRTTELAALLGAG